MFDTEFVVVSEATTVDEGVSDNDTLSVADSCELTVADSVSDSLDVAVVLSVGSDVGEGEGEAVTSSDSLRLPVTDCDRCSLADGVGVPELERMIVGVDDIVVDCDVDPENSYVSVCVRTQENVRVSLDDSEALTDTDFRTVCDAEDDPDGDTDTVVLLDTDLLLSLDNVSDVVAVGRIVSDVVCETVHDIDFDTENDAVTAKDNVGDSERVADFADD